MKKISMNEKNMNEWIWINEDKWEWMNFDWKNEYKWKKINKWI